MLKCFYSPFYSFCYDTLMHRKWVRLKCVRYLLLDALFHFEYIYISFVSIFESFKPNLKALNKSTCWEITQEFCRVLEVIPSVITAPYPFCFGFCVKFNYF